MKKLNQEKIRIKKEKKDGIVNSSNRIKQKKVETLIKENDSWEEYLGV